MAVRQKIGVEAAMSAIFNTHRTGGGDQPGAAAVRLRQQTGRTGLAQQCRIRPRQFHRRLSGRQQRPGRQRFHARPRRHEQHGPARPGGPRRTGALRRHDGQRRRRRVRRLRAAGGGSDTGRAQLRRLSGRTLERGRCRAVAAPASGRGPRRQPRAGRHHRSPCRGWSRRAPCCRRAGWRPPTSRSPSTPPRSQGWRRPLLAWLGIAVQRARAAGDSAEVARIERRIALAGGK